VHRRAFLGSLAGGLLAAPLAAQAQQAGRVYRIGFLSPGGSEQDSSLWAPLQGVLRERGWAVGKNLVFERRYAEGSYDQLPELAAELVRLKLDLLVARGGPADLAAKRRFPS